MMPRPLTSDAIRALELDEAARRHQTREESIRAAVERHNRLMAADGLWRDGEPVEPLTQGGAV